MPIQAPQWMEFLTCPICRRDYGPPMRLPISLGCGHTICKQCLTHLHRKQCPFDQTIIYSDINNMVVNSALLQLVGVKAPPRPYHPPKIEMLPDKDKHFYDISTQCIEELALYLNYNNNAALCTARLSRPMQRKLITLVQCAISEEEGRCRAYRAARSLGERTVTELIIHHQNPQQLSVNLWAAVRARGCQFLGPAMQEEVLKLILLALEDGSALSRKVLVMFVVQRLEKLYSKASKTSIGHVVQLLYRASCFKVSKRDSDSSLMKLKEDYRTYGSLRREHDTQIVQIASETGLRIAPEQWSSLLYGDIAHKSHMQSIIDTLQTQQSFVQSVQELLIGLQRTGDPERLGALGPHLELLAAIDPSSADLALPTWQNLFQALEAAKIVVIGLVYFICHRESILLDNNHNHLHGYPLLKSRTDLNSSSIPIQESTTSNPINEKHLSVIQQIPSEHTIQSYQHKVLMSNDDMRRACPRGDICTFARDNEELQMCRLINRNKIQALQTPPRSDNTTIYHMGDDFINNGDLSAQLESLYNLSLTNGTSKILRNIQISSPTSYRANAEHSPCFSTPPEISNGDARGLNNFTEPSGSGISSQNEHQTPSLIDQRFNQGLKSLSLDTGILNQTEYYQTHHVLLSNDRCANNTVTSPTKKFSQYDTLPTSNHSENLFSQSTPFQPYKLFVRSDSLESDDDYVPFETQMPSKYGPIKRFVGPMSTSDQSNHNITNNQSEIRESVGTIQRQSSQSEKRS